MVCFGVHKSQTRPRSLCPQPITCTSSRPLLFLTHTTATTVPSRTTSMIIDPEMKRKEETKSFSLAGPYLVEITREASSTSSFCSLYDLEALESQADQAFRHSEGALAWSCIVNNRHLINDVTPQVEIRIEQNDQTFQLLVMVKQQNKGAHGTNPDLYQVLARILVQESLRNLPKSQEDGPVWSICWGDTVDSPMSCSVAQEWKTEELLQALFTGIVDIVPGETEMVEMVDQLGRPIGQVPRKLVHKHNLLHRGIGLFVTKDVPIQQSSVEPQDQPQLYVHQRTATKRIFPSLYDMFVGGVSTAMEPSRVTAEREVAEELGLSRGSTNLSDCLWTCIVCTAYNRCVVDFFTYTMQTEEESISWQEEEVAWGAFVPYKVVAASADLSIKRFVEQKEWPGRLPPVLSGVQTDDITTDDFGGHGRWDQWDYVPDGLLVWEAWLEWSESRK